MKVAWRSILNSYKESEAGVKHTVLQKQHFPRFLKSLMDALLPNYKENLKSGFRKCGIQPCEVDELLKRLRDDNKPHDSSEVENSFIDYLKKTRAEVLGNTSTSLSRRKKILVSPERVLPITLLLIFLQRNLLHQIQKVILMTFQFMTFQVVLKTSLI